MKSILLTILMFAIIISLISVVSVQANESEVGAGIFTIEDPSGGSVRFLKFQDGDVTCYAPVNRAGISCIYHVF